MTCQELAYTRMKCMRFVILAGIVLSHIGCYYTFFSLVSEKSSVRESLQEKITDNEKTNNPSIRLYSAFIDRKYNVNSKYSTKSRPLVHRNIIVVLIWQKNKNIINSFKCCVLQGRDNIITSKSSKTNHCFHEKGLLRASRIECPLVGNVSKLTGVSLAKWTMSCPNDTRYYVTPTILDPSPRKSKWAMCNKYFYGPGPNARLLAEWFEIHRFLGVDKFTIHHENTINSATRKVLQFYRKEGLADVLHIEAPYKDTINRHDHHPRYELFNDEQIGLWDCRERHKYYEFSAEIDTDEFILPHVMNENAIKTILADTFKRSHVGVVAFYTYIHMTSWKSANATHPMFIGQYENSTEPLIEATKNMYMPSRMKIEEGTIHNIYPKPGFTRIYLNPSKAAIHHFRPCRQNWLNHFPVKIFRKGTVTQVTVTCSTLPRVRAINKKEQGIETIRKRVEQVYSKLHI